MLVESFTHFLQDNYTASQIIKALRKHVLSDRTMPTPHDIVAILEQENFEPDLEKEGFKPWVLSLVRDGTVDYVWAKSWLQPCELEGQTLYCPSLFHANWLKTSGNHILNAIEKKKGISFCIAVAV